MLRREREMTLKDVSQTTGLSISLLSLIERGGGNPPIGTLVAIANTLSVSVTDLLREVATPTSDAVTRREEQAIYGAEKGTARRVLVRSADAGIEIVENTYAPGAVSAHAPHRHHGWEGGVVIEGDLDVDLQNVIHRLRCGDAVSFASSQPHRFLNRGRKVARTIWVNVHH